MAEQVEKHALALFAVHALIDSKLSFERSAHDSDALTGLECGGRARKPNKPAALAAAELADEGIG